jgi:hypothetical protein
MRDMTANHGGTPPPTACERIRVARPTLRSRSKRGRCEPTEHLLSQHISPLITRAQRQASERLCRP